MKTYRLAIIGLGRMGSTIDAEVEGYPSIALPYSIAASAKALPNVELAAGCDLKPEKNEAFSQKWGVPPRALYTDYKRMLAAERPDLVAICTPGPLHARMTVDCAEAGVPMIYCEKAMACSMKEADAARKAVEGRHVAFNTGVLRRFDVRYHQARRLIQEGKIGQPRAVVHYAPASLLHGHIHSVDTILFLLSRQAGDRLEWPRARSVRGEFRPRDLVIKDNRSDKDPQAVYQIELEGGVEAMTVPAGNWDFEVLGDEGMLRSMNNNIDWGLRTRQPLGKKFHTFLPADYPTVEPRSATVDCLRDLIEAHEQHKATLGEVKVTHHATEICLAVAESHRQGGTRVTLPLANRELYVYHF
jgi:predicted dehydrogenase